MMAACDGIEMMNSRPDVPPISSLPGAVRTLFVDFDGEPPRGWNEGFLGFGGHDVPRIPRYTIDADTGSFSREEQQNICQAMDIVIEKFSIFDVNITTIDPGRLVNRRSSKIVVGGDGAWYGRGGGVAIRGGFYDDEERIGWVWDGRDDPNYIGETVAHEFGHMLGLRHQSNAPFTAAANQEYANGWIMGAGAAGSRPGRWRIGATTERDGDDIEVEGNQDDIGAIVALSGIPLRADEHPDFVPTPLLSDGFGGLRQQGIIHSLVDVDSFQFTMVGGQISVTLTTAPFGAMLDGQFELIGPGTNSGSINTGIDMDSWNSESNLPAGTYTIHVRSAGGMGDVGQYSLGVTVETDNVMANARPVGRFGTLPSGGPFGGLQHPIYAGRGDIVDSVGSADRQDWYRIELEKGVPNRISAWLTGLSTDVDLQLFQDRNHNLQVDPGESLAISRNSGNNNEALTAHGGEGGTFYLHVTRFGTGNSPYQLTIFVEHAGDLTPGSTLAYRDASPKSPRFDGYREYFDHVFRFDAQDIYRFTADRSGDVDIGVDLLTQAARLTLYHDQNRDGFPAGLLPPDPLVINPNTEIVARSDNSGPAAELIQNAPLIAGETYFVVVENKILPPSQDTDTNYRLWVHSDYAPGPTSLGNVNLLRPQFIYDYVGGMDQSDEWTFKVRPGGIVVTGTDIHSYVTYIDLDNDGVFENTEVAGTGSRQVVEVPDVFGDGREVAMAVHVRRRGPLEFSSEGNYLLRILPALPLNNNALLVASLITPISTRNRVTGALGYSSEFAEMDDAVDMYRFRLDSPKRFLATLTGDTPQSTSLLGLQLLRDDNGDQQPDANERLFGFSLDDRDAATSLDVLLEPGDYFLRSFLRPGEMTYGTVVAGYTLEYFVDEPVADPVPLVTKAELGPSDPSRSSLWLHFSENVSATLDRTDLSLTRNLAGVTEPVVDLQLGWDAATNRANVNFVVPAPSNSRAGRYTVRVPAGGGIRDVRGQALANSLELDFGLVPGDSNFDGVFDSSDLIRIFQTGEYEDQRPRNSTWEDGDWNLDGEFDSGDLVYAFQAGSYSTSVPATPTAQALAVDAAMASTAWPGARPGARY
jgi:hypothetical protein